MVIRIEDACGDVTGRSPNLDRSGRGSPNLSNLAKVLGSRVWFFLRQPSGASLPTTWLQRKFPCKRASGVGRNYDPWDSQCLRAGLMFGLVFSNGINGSGGLNFYYERRLQSTRDPTHTLQVVRVARILRGSGGSASHLLSPVGPPPPGSRTRTRNSCSERVDKNSRIFRTGDA